MRIEVNQEVTSIGRVKSKLLNKIIKTRLQKRGVNFK